MFLAFIFRINQKILDGLHVVFAQSSHDAGKISENIKAKTLLELPAHTAKMLLFITIALKLTFFVSGATSNFQT